MKYVKRDNIGRIEKLIPILRTEVKIIQALKNGENLTEELG